jgi:hypothetical protein
MKVFLFCMLFLPSLATAQWDTVVTPAPAPWPVPAHKPASNWKKYSSSSDGTLYYDKSRVRSIGKNRYSVWVTQAPESWEIDDVRKRLGNETSFYNYSKYTHTMTRYEVDCLTERIRTTTQVEYNADGTTIKSFSNSETKWNYVIPGSIGESLYEVICNKK